MALFKERVDDRGVTTSYHKVSSADVRDNTLSCTVDSYVSKDYRDAEQSAGSSYFQFEITTEQEESMGIRQLCYTQLKTLEEWSDAEDC